MCAEDPDGIASSSFTLASECRDTMYECAVSCSIHVLTKKLMNKWTISTFCVVRPHDLPFRFPGGAAQEPAKNAVSAPFNSIDKTLLIYSLYMYIIMNCFPRRL